MPRSPQKLAMGGPRRANAALDSLLYRSFHLRRARRNCGDVAGRTCRPGSAVSCSRGSPLWNFAFSNRPARRAQAGAGAARSGGPAARTTLGHQAVRVSVLVQLRYRTSEGRRADRHRTSVQTRPRRELLGRGRSTALWAVQTAKLRPASMKAAKSRIRARTGLRIASASETILCRATFAGPGRITVVQWPAVRVRDVERKSFIAIRACSTAA